MAIDTTDPFEVHEVRELTGHKTKVSGKEGCSTCMHATYCWAVLRSVALLQVFCVDWSNNGKRLASGGHRA